MSFPKSSTGPSLADDQNLTTAKPARLAAVLATLIAAQADLDELSEGIAAARLDAAIEAVRAAMQSAGRS